MQQPDSSQLQALAALLAPPVLMDALRALQREVSELRQEISKRSDDNRWLDSDEAADYLGMSENTFEKYRSPSSEFRIPGCKVGGKTKFKKNELDRWVKLWEVRALGIQ